MIRRSFVCLAFAGLFSITPAAAQEADTLTTSLRPGARSLSFGALGGGGGSFQYWRMRSQRTNLGLTIVLDLDYVHAERTTRAGEEGFDIGRASISAGPALRRYVTTTSRVNPFLYGHALVGYHFQAQETSTRPDANTQHGASATLASGVGAEWFPVRSISFSGQTGVQFGMRFLFGELGPQSTEDYNLFANTFTSSLSVNLYWLPRVR